MCLAVLSFAACSSHRKAVVEKVPETSTWKSGESVTARVSVSLSGMGTRNVKLNGTLRMKRDDVIQLNLTYIFGMQIGTMELTRDNVLLVSRMTRQYVVLSYPELSSLLERTVTFDDMQHIFWGEARDFAVKGVDWKYGTFSKMSDERVLPGELSMTFSGGSMTLGLSMKLTKHSYDDSWTKRTSVKTSTYEKLSYDQALKLVTMLMNN